MVLFSINADDKHARRLVTTEINHENSEHRQDGGNARTNDGNEI
jgi:hypothetical protein